MLPSETKKGRQAECGGICGAPQTAHQRVVCDLMSSLKLAIWIRFFSYAIVLNYVPLE